MDAKLAGHLVAGRGRDLHVAALRAIANAAGGEEAFVRADAAERTATVRRVEENVRGAFRALVSLVLEEYYEAEPVLLAMGWSTGPPQPQGHLLAPFDADLLGPVKRRKPMWR